MSTNRSEQLKKKKSRRLMHAISVGFGVIAILIIVKGFRDIQVKLKNRPYFDRIIEARDTMRTFTRNDIRIDIYPGGSVRFFSGDFDRSRTLAVQGNSVIRSARPLHLLTQGGTLDLFSGEMYLHTGRFNRFCLLRGKAVYNNKTYSGSNICFDEYRRKTDTLPQPPDPGVFFSSGGD